MKNLKILVAEDCPLFKKKLINLFKANQCTSNLFQACHSDEVLTHVNRENIDFIFLSIRLPGANAIDITLKIKSIFPKIRIIILLTIDNQFQIAKIFKAGANGILLKDIQWNKLSKFIESELFSAEGENDFTGYSKNQIWNDTREKLTAREIEVLILICKQFKNAEIADELHISEKTVEVHRDHIMSKSQSINVVGLILYAIEKQYYLV